MSTPTPRFENDDQAAQHWLAVLRDGDPDQKIMARGQLAAIFERRGMLSEAAELLEGNARAGVRSRDLFLHLAALYRSVGRDDEALAASAEAALLGRPTPPPAPAAQGWPPVEVPPIAPTRRPWYRSMGVIIGASALCLPPLSLALVWMRPWRQAIKIAASVPLTLWTFLWLTSIISGMVRPTTPAAPRAAATSTVAVAAPTVAAAPPTVAVAVAAKVEPTPRPTATTVPPTATTVPAPTVLFTGRFEPSLLRVGAKLVVELTLENKSDRQIEGIRIASSGPWDKYTIVNVMPGGRHESGFLGGHSFYTNMVIPPGQKRALNVVAYPNEPGSHDFTFTAHHNTTQRLTPADGGDIMIGGKVSVIR